MKKVNSISGGKTSAYIAANYPADYDLFSLVRIEDQRCKFPDEKIRKEVEDRIQTDFIATAEDDMIIYTMLDLEQKIGRKITWVTGDTFDYVVTNRGGWLPNKLHRFCTTHLKIEPMFYWWAETIGEPIEMRIGFRANELSRVETMMGKTNGNGFLEFKATFGKHMDGRFKGKNKWESVEWQKPVFPLVETPTFKDQIEKYWSTESVRFADLNNCVGCFHRNPLLLRKMYDKHPCKIEWFADQEVKQKSQWRSDTSYFKIINHKLQIELSFDDFSECDSGQCGI